MNKQYDSTKMEQPDECLFYGCACCYLIEYCKNCPMHPENNDMYWNMSVSDIV